ncbi:hypothetical protein BT69DRAFT_1332481 [Atractiella rhizophila]|nr:hypothetical protein BT69DRAFT_1332481 [Atractiella rhizophila]
MSLEDPPASDIQHPLQSVIQVSPSDPPLESLSATCHDPRFPSLAPDPFSTHAHGRGDSLFTLVDAPPGPEIPAGHAVPKELWAEQSSWNVGDLVGPQGDWVVQAGYGRPDYAWWTIIRATIGLSIWIFTTAKPQYLLECASKKFASKSSQFALQTLFSLFSTKKATAGV